MDDFAVFHVAGSHPIIRAEVMHAKPGTSDQMVQHHKMCDAACQAIVQAHDLPAAGSCPKLEASANPRS